MIVFVSFVCNGTFVCELIIVSCYFFVFLIVCVKFPIKIDRTCFLFFIFFFVLPCVLQFHELCAVWFVVGLCFDFLFE